MKVGMDLRMSSSLPRYSFTPGNASYTFLNGRPSSVTFSAGPVGTYTHVRPNLGLYAQEQLTLRRLTLNGGVRLDWFETSYPDQTLEASRYRPVALNFQAGKVLSWKDLNPRMGVAYDVRGDGRTALKWSLGRYISQEATTLTELVNPVSAISGNQTRTWNDANGDFAIQGDPLVFTAN